MSLLIPELERQLRAAARDLHQDAGHAGQQVRRGRSVIGRTVLATTVLVAVAIAVVALTTLRGSPGPRTTGSRTPLLVTPRCGKATPPSSQPQASYRTAASGTIAGKPWQFQVEQELHGRAASYTGRLLLAGRAYGLCRKSIQIELINRRGNGIAYAFVGLHRTVAIEVGISGRPTTLVASAHPVPGGAFFILQLPNPTCHYRAISFAWTTVSGTRARGTRPPVPTIPFTGTPTVTMPTTTQPSPTTTAAGVSTTTPRPGATTTQTFAPTATTQTATIPVGGAVSPILARTRAAAATTHSTAVYLGACGNGQLASVTFAR